MNSGMIVIFVLYLRSIDKKSAFRLFIRLNLASHFLLFIGID